MVVLYTTTTQTLTTGQSVTFNGLRKTGCSEYVRGTAPQQVFLKPDGLYLLDFSGDVTGATAATPVQIQAELSGAPIPETLRTSVPAAANDLNSVSAATAVSTAANCCFDLGSLNVTVTNTGVNPITIGPGFALRIVRAG